MRAKRSNPKREPAHNTPPGCVIWYGAVEEYQRLLAERTRELAVLEGMAAKDAGRDWGLRNHIADLRVKVSDLKEAIAALGGLIKQ